MEIMIDEMNALDRATFLRWMDRRIADAVGGDTPSFPAGWLPKTGLAARDRDGSPVAMTLLYLEKSSPVAVAGWCVSRPCLPAFEAASAVKLLLAALPSYARKLGAQHLMTIYGNRGINAVLDRIGFLAGDQNVEHKHLYLGGPK